MQSWDKNTSCLVAYKHFYFKLTWIFSKTILITSVNLNKFCRVVKHLITTRNMVVFLMALCVLIQKLPLTSCCAINWTNQLYYSTHYIIIYGNWGSITLFFLHVNTKMFASLVKETLIALTYSSKMADLRSWHDAACKPVLCGDNI